MTAWTPDELSTVDRVDELELSSRRPDGSLRGFVTMWAVRVGSDVFVRSARQENPWFRRAVASGSGRIRIGGVVKDVAFERVVDGGDALDAAYHAKYDRYGAGTVGTVVGPAAHGRTLRVIPSI
ncbi:hypothetical protein GCM10009775_08080 [Microbacterium aoyamense]|uniref:DUF2255 family protein n=1 Tax=Microbacterium aoyamense TaxID=344166 RepID=A0ABN2PC85_9MICO|nr:DUF2255 family protein [Microbacterium aoyamense]